MLSEASIDGLDVVEKLVFSLPVLRACNIIRWEFFPLFRQDRQVGLNVGLLTGLGDFVGLGEHDDEGDAILAQEGQEIEVFLLWLVADIDEHTETGELLAFEHIMGDEVPEFVHLTFTSLCISVTRQVDEIPAPVDEEVIDKHGLAWSAGGHGKFPFARKHIDETGLAYIRATDEGVFGQIGLRTHIGPRTAAYKFCGLDFHHKYVILCKDSKIIV